jgi:hypothetical protein
MALSTFLTGLLQCLLKLLNFLGELRKVLVYRITFILSAFLSIAEIGFLLSVLLKPTTITSVVRGIHAPMLLAQVAVLLKVAIELVPGCFFPFSLLLEDFSEDSDSPFS